jgi:hypothetical protein
MFSSHRKVMKSLRVGTGHSPLQSVNYHDSRAPDQEGPGILSILVGTGSGIGWYGFGLCLSLFLLWLGKVVNQLPFSRLLGNLCSQGS